MKFWWVSFECISSSTYIYTMLYKKKSHTNVCFLSFHKAPNIKNLGRGLYGGRFMKLVVRTSRIAFRAYVWRGCIFRTIVISFSQVCCFTIAICRMYNAQCRDWFVHTSVDALQWICKYAEKFRVESSKTFGPNEPISHTFNQKQPLHA